MIVFDLSCNCGFQFEAWFQSHDDYENQVKHQLLECPVCTGKDIHKILSPVAVRRQKNSEQLPSGQAVFSAPSSASPEEKQAYEFIKGLKKFVESNFENVGTNLASEALKIHYGVEEARNIRGIATKKEEKMLKDEGVNLLKIPISLDDDKGETN